MKTKLIPVSNIFPGKIIGQDQKHCLSIIKSLEILSLCLIGIILLEGTVIIFSLLNQDIRISPRIDQKYHEALYNHAWIKAQNEIYESVDREDANLVYAVERLACIMPKQLKLTGLQISKDDGVLIEGVGTEPTSFMAYTNLINDEKSIFKNARLQSMSSILSQKTFMIKTDLVKNAKN